MQLKKPHYLGWLNISIICPNLLFSDKVCTMYQR